MKINSNTIKLEKESYLKLEKVVKKIASENKIENVGNVEVKLSKENGVIKFATTFELNDAIEDNDCPQVQVLLQTGSELSMWSIIYAIESNNPQMVQIILDAGGGNWKSFRDGVAFECAFEVNNPEIVKILLDAGAPMEDSSLSKAINTNNVDIVKLMIDARAPFTEGTLNIAIFNRNLEIIKMVCESGRAIATYQSMNNAIHTQDPEIVKTLLLYGLRPDNERRYPRNSSFNQAICLGNIEIIKMLIQVGAQINSETYACTIETNNPEVIDLVKSYYKMRGYSFG